MSLHPTPAIQPPPPSKFIPAGKFIDIDDKYYRPQEKKYYLEQEAFGSQGKPLQPYSVKYGTSGFVKKAPTLPLGPYVVNYGSYIYQQQTGFQ